MGKGDFLLHLGPERHERLRKAAEAEGTSMAQFLTDALEARICAGQPGAESVKSALRLVERAVRQLIDGPDPGDPGGFQAPSGEHKENHWDKLMSDG